MLKKRLTNRTKIPFTNDQRHTPLQIIHSKKIYHLNLNVVVYFSTEISSTFSSSKISSLIFSSALLSPSERLVSCSVYSISIALKAFNQDFSDPRLPQTSPILKVTFRKNQYRQCSVHMSQIKFLGNLGQKVETSCSKRIP